MKPRIDEPIPFRSRRAMVAAPFGTSIFFFGGVGATGVESILDVSNDIWRFDSRTFAWEGVPQSGPWPTPRRYPGWTPAGGRLLLFAGSGVGPGPAGADTYTFSNDLWEFHPDVGAWKELEPSDDYQRAPAGADRPVPRYTPVFHSAGKGLFLFGGYTEDRLSKRKLNDAWFWEAGGGWTAVRQDGLSGYSTGCVWPGLRYGSMSVEWAGQVYVLGGFSDDGDHNDLWRFDLSCRRWELLCPDSSSADVPEARYCGAVAMAGGRLLLFGGRSRQHPKRNFNDLWEIDLATMNWRQVSPNRDAHFYDRRVDSPAYHAKSAAAVVDNYWYILGGEGRRGHVSDFWRLNLTSYDWELLQECRPDDPVFW